MKRVLIILICLVAIIPIAQATTDYLWLYSSWFSSSAVNAARDASPLISMDGDAEAIYRLGFAAGYDTALSSPEILGVPNSGSGYVNTRAMIPYDDNGIYTGETYIVNTESNKFHIPGGCPSERAILPEHRKEVHGTFEEVRQMGYSPCGRCFK